MTSIRELLDGHMIWEVEFLDRLYRNGYRFHRSKALTSDALMEWIARDSYLTDWKIPQALCHRPVGPR